MITPQERIIQLEQERQALYLLGNGPHIDSDARERRLGEIAGLLETLWRDERIRRAKTKAPVDAAWEQRRS